MVGRAYRLRLRRRIKVRRQQATELGREAELRFDQLLLKRLERLVPVGRFVSAWVLLLVLIGGITIVQAQNLNNYYEFLKPVNGGVYTEGIVGSFTTTNPLFAVDAPDVSVSRLLFAGLFRNDDSGKLVPDLAQSWKLSENETTYTVTLRQNLRWSDGQPLTAKDVAYTYHTIQNPDAGSPLLASWQGVTVKQVDSRTVSFTLSTPLSSFVYSLTNGIVPEHILAKEQVGNLRTSLFNTVSTVGCGPFVLRKVEVQGSAASQREERIAMAASDTYHEGRPGLDGFVLRVFSSDEQMIEQFNERKVDGMVGLTSVSSDINNADSVISYSFPLRASVMVFFKTSQGVLADKQVRQALVRATDTNAIIGALGYPAVPVTEPLLRSQLGYDPALQQASFDAPAAKKMLDDAGWTAQKDGIRVKDGKKLQFSLHAMNNPEFVKVSKLLQQQWRAVGVDMKVSLESGSELDAVVSSHDYDALLNGITIGADPDVYAFWHSSQADVRSQTRLNFSEYKSSVVDESISAGRTRSSEKLRAIKYKPFLQAWQQDAPAVGLYQPRFLYVSREPIYGLREHPITTGLGRYSNVAHWQIRQARVSQ